MAAGEYNFNIDKNAVFYITFEYKDANLQTIDLTGWCARLAMESVDADKPVVTTTFISDKISSDYSFTITPNEGKISLILPAATTQNFNFNQAKYDLDLKSPTEVYPGGGPQIIKVLKGFINIVGGNVASPAAFNCLVLP